MALLDVRRGRLGDQERAVVDAAQRYFANMRFRATLGRRGMLALVIAPTLVAAVYFGLWASDRYVSEATFIVRGVSSSRGSGLEMLFRTFGIARTVDDTNVVQNFMLSRDAVRELERQLPLRAMFASDKADFFSKYPQFWRSDSFESLYLYYQQHVSVYDDSNKGLTILRVDMFRPEESRRVALALLALAEDMVNRMNARALRDSVETARAEVARAETRLVDAQADLTRFRNQEMLVDPTKVSGSMIDTVASLSKELSLLLAQMQETLKMSPTSPALPVLRAKSDALQDQVNAVRAGLAGNDAAMAGKVSTYERLSLMRELAEKALGNAETALATALQEAGRKQIYIETVTEPNLPDESTEPQRLRAVAAVFVVSFAAFAVIWILTVGAREHAN